MVVLQRDENWPLLLSSYLSERKDMPFIWGENDCLMFTSHLVELLTGVNFYYPYQTYHDEAGAVKVLEDNGGVVGIINKCLGQGKRDILNAKRGDVVIFKSPEITSGVVDDSGRFIVSVSRDGGLMRLPLKSAWRYWSY